jgi:hypothetical protein
LTPSEQGVLLAYWQISETSVTSAQGTNSGMEAFSPPGVAEREESPHELVKTILKNMKVNGKDYPIKIMEHEIHV